MIYVTRLDGSVFVVNAFLIETMEESPDTVISLTTGRKYVVKESVDELVAAIVEFHRRTNTRLRQGPKE